MAVKFGRGLEDHCDNYGESQIGETTKKAAVKGSEKLAGGSETGRSGVGPSKEQIWE